MLPFEEPPIATKANVLDVHNREELDGQLKGKASTGELQEARTQIAEALRQKVQCGTVYTKEEADAALALKLEKIQTFTKTEVDMLLSAKAMAVDVYTKTDIDSLLGEIYKKDEVDSTLSRVDRPCHRSQR